MNGRKIGIVVGGSVTLVAICLVLWLVLKHGTVIKPTPQLLSTDEDFSVIKDSIVDVSSTVNVSLTPSRQSAYITDDLFSIIKDAIAKVGFSAEFHKGDLAVYDFYTENFLRLLQCKMPLFDVEAQQEYCLDRFFEITGQNASNLYDPMRFSYYFFDMDLDSDSGPELCITNESGFLYIIKYEPNTNRFILWHDVGMGQLLGSKEICYYKGNTRGLFAYRKLDQTGKVECKVSFYFEGYYDNINAVELPDYVDESKNIVLSEAMKNQAFYADIYDANYFRITEEQWKELRKDFIRAEELAKERIKEVSFTFDELFEKKNNFS